MCTRKRKDKIDSKAKDKRRNNDISSIRVKKNSFVFFFPDIIIISGEVVLVK